jgi:hypothetical protein
MLTKIFKDYFENMLLSEDGYITCIEELLCLCPPTVLNLDKYAKQERPHQAVWLADDYERTTEYAFIELHFSDGQFFSFNGWFAHELETKSHVFSHTTLNTFARLLWEWHQRHHPTHPFVTDNPFQF